MLKFSRLLQVLTLTGMIMLPCSSAFAALPGGFSKQAKSSQASEAVSANGFSIVPPAGWKQGDSSENTILMFVGPAVNGFGVNLNVNLSEDDGTTADQLGDMIRPVYAKEFQKWKIMDEGITEIAGVDAYYISSSFTMQGKNIQNLQYFIPGKNKRYYIVTFTALASNYAQYADAFKEAAESVETSEDE